MALRYFVNFSFDSYENGLLLAYFATWSRYRSFNKICKRLYQRFLNTITLTICVIEECPSLVVDSRVLGNKQKLARYSVSFIKDVLRRRAVVPQFFTSSKYEVFWSAVWVSELFCFETWCFLLERVCIVKPYRDNRC